MLDQLKTSVLPMWLLGDRLKFILHKLPGTVNLHSEYFLSTQAYPDYVATIRATKGTAFSPFGVYEVGLDRNYKPAQLLVRVCDAGNGYVRFGSSGEHTIWAYIHHGSWNVYGWRAGSPGDGG